MALISDRQRTRSPWQGVVSAALSPGRALQRLRSPGALASYAESRSSPLPPYLDAVQRRTHAAVSEDAHMMVSSVQAQLLATLVHATAARRVLEIGTFTGYSTLAMARALPADGVVITCELDPERARLARQHFDASPGGDRIRLEVGPALDTVRRVEGPFDLVLIDADKTGYLDYYRAAMPKVGPRGLLVADNTLYLGLDAGAEPDSPEVRAIEAFNDAVAADEGVEQVVLTLWDGMTIVRPVGQAGSGAR